MKDLIKKIEQTGWFSGELAIDISIRRAFEGYHGIASEDWETQYKITSNGLSDTNGNEVFPKLDMVSKKHESFEDFINRVEACIKAA